VIREQDAANLSVVRLRLTENGAAQLDALSEHDLEDLARLHATVPTVRDTKR
jgi:hypothetical protein